MSRNFVRLKILSRNRSAEEISRIVGLRCEKSWRPGDFRHNTLIKEETHGWIITSGLPESIALQHHLDAVLARLGPHAREVEGLSHDGETTVELSCAIYSEGAPELNFSRAVIRQLNELGASLDIDLYIL